MAAPIGLATLSACIAVASRRYEPGGWGAFPAIVVDSFDGDQMFAGADVGGLFASSDGGASWNTCNHHQLQTVFILDLQLIQSNSTASTLLVGTSHGVYVGVRALSPLDRAVNHSSLDNQRQTSQRSHSNPCEAWNFMLSNAGFLTANSTASMKADGEEFAHPVAALFHDPDHRLVVSAISINKARGPARPRAGDPFSVYISLLDVARTTASQPLNWTGILKFTSPINVFSFAVANGTLYVATDQGLYSTDLAAGPFERIGKTWFELGVSPAMVSIDRGLHWQLCDQILCPASMGSSGTPTCTPLPQPPSPIMGSGLHCLPTTLQMNRTHPNVRTVVASGDLIYVTLWDEGWIPCNGSESSYVDVNRSWYRGGAFVSGDGGKSFDWLFASALFPNSTLRCTAQQPSKYITGNFPHIAVDPADPRHILLAGWGNPGQGLYELEDGVWKQWGACGISDTSNPVSAADCFDGARVDSLTLDSNQYAFDFRVVSWSSNRTVSVADRVTSAVTSETGVSRPEVVFTDSRGAVHGVWDPTHHRFGFLHLNDHYVGIDSETTLPAWHSTGLGDTCVNAAVMLPSGTLLLAVADGGVARTADDGTTWTRPAELWPGALASTSQGEAIVHDPQNNCTYVTHYDRGGTNAGTVLASCSDGAAWHVIGGWAGNLTDLRGTNGLNISGSMRDQLTLDFRATSGSKSRAMFVSSVDGALFHGVPGSVPRATFRWAKLVVPPLNANGGPRGSTQINALVTVPLAPSLVFMARADGFWIGQLTGTVLEWNPPVEHLYNPASMIVLPPGLTDKPEQLRVVVGAAIGSYGDHPAIFSGVIDAVTGAILTNFTPRYVVDANNGSASAAQQSALAFATIGGEPRLFAGLHAGDYFDLFTPQYILESTDGGQMFVPSRSAAGITNTNVAGLTTFGSGTVCVSTNGDGLQCFE
jgi:hypothetical protein